MHIWPFGGMQKQGSSDSGLCAPFTALLFEPWICVSVLKDASLTLTQALHGIAFLTWNALFIWHWGHAENEHLCLWIFAQFSAVFSTTGCVWVHMLCSALQFYFWACRFCNLHLALAIVHTHSSVFSNSGFVWVCSRMHSWPWTLWACTSVHLWLWTKRPGTVVDLCLDSFTHFASKMSFLHQICLYSLFKLPDSLHFSCYLGHK